LASLQDRRPNALAIEFARNGEADEARSDDKRVRFGGHTRF